MGLWLVIIENNDPNLFGDSSFAAISIDLTSRRYDKKY